MDHRAVEPIWLGSEATEGCRALKKIVAGENLADPALAGIGRK